MHIIPDVSIGQENLFEVLVHCKKELLVQNCINLQVTENALQRDKSIFRALMK